MSAELWGLAALVLAVLVGCGGGGDEPQQQPQHQCAPVRVQLFGDSTQAGYDGGTGAIAPHNPTAALQAYFDAQHGAGRVVVENMAHDGTTTGDLLAGLDKFGAQVAPPWPAVVHADVIVINHGINDAHHPGADLAVYRAHLETLATAPGARVVFETPNMVKGLDIAPYAQAMREVAAARGLALVDTYAYTSALPDWAVLIPDWAHPSDALYASISANVMQPVLGPIVGALVAGCK